MHMALLSAEKPEAVTNRWPIATLFLSMGHIILFHCSYRFSLYGLKNHFDKEARMKFVHFFRGKLVAAAIAGVIIVGGATAAFAATPAGQDLVHTLTGPAHTKATANAADSQAGDSHANNQHANSGNKSTCPGLPDAQRLAGQFAL